MVGRVDDGNRLLIYLAKATTEVRILHHTQIMTQREIRHCEKHGDTEFAKCKAGKEGIRWRCMKCQVQATQKRRDKVKYMSVAYKGGKCQCCGYNKCIGALEFHHVDPTQKDFGISSKGYTRSWDKVKEEIGKCVLVCANCHREIHSELIPCPTELINDEDAANSIKM